MKLKLTSHNIEPLKTSLSLLSHLRKLATLRITPDQLLVISNDETAVTYEPQVWCKLRMGDIFEQIEVHSLKDNSIYLELNVDSLLQVLRNFDKASSSSLSIRLQRKDEGGVNGGSTDSGRMGSLALLYSNVNSHQNVINHIFRVPVKILKQSSDSSSMREPELSDVRLMMKLPKQFSAVYKRLDKFKKSLHCENITIHASRRQGGVLHFVLEEYGKYKVTISWNEEFEVQKPDLPSLNSDSLRSATFGSRGNDSEMDEDDMEQDNHFNNDHDDDVTDDVAIRVRLRDWQSTSKLVATCKTVVLLFTDRDCILHCMLDDSDGAEIIHYISGTIIRDPYDV